MSQIGDYEKTIELVPVRLPQGIPSPVETETPDVVPAPAQPRREPVPVPIEK